MELVVIGALPGLVKFKFQGLSSSLAGTAWGEVVFKWGSGGSWKVALLVLIASGDLEQGELFGTEAKEAQRAAWYL